MENRDSATAQEYVVDLENVVISYDEDPVLKEVNLRLGAGDFVYLIGKSGAGKTSLLRSLYADQPIESGVYELNELIKVDDFTKTYTIEETLHTVHGYDVSVCYQVNGGTEQDGDTVTLDTVSTDSENPTTVAYADDYSDAPVQNQIAKTLEAVGIADKADVLPTRLSEGEQQRVGIARALINNPSLILADEPTGNLDPATSSDIMQLLVDINQQTGTAMLISTHDFMMIDKFQSRLLVCENGTITDPTAEDVNTKNNTLTQ